MHIETVEELVDWIADKLGLYGTCKNAEKSKDCTIEGPFCCRMGFQIEMTRRIEEAVENDKRITDILVFSPAIAPGTSLSLEVWIRNKLQENEEMHDYAVATESVRIWIDQWRSLNPLVKSETSN